MGKTKDTGHPHTVTTRKQRETGRLGANRAGKNAHREPAQRAKNTNEKAGKTTGARLASAEPNKRNKTPAES